MPCSASVWSISELLLPGPMVQMIFVRLVLLKPAITKRVIMVQGNDAYFSMEESFSEMLLAEVVSLTIIMQLFGEDRINFQALSRVKRHRSIILQLQLCCWLLLILLFLSNASLFLSCRSLGLYEQPCACCICRSAARCVASFPETPKAGRESAHHRDRLYSPMTDETSRDRNVDRGIIFQWTAYQYIPARSSPLESDGRTSGKNISHTPSILTCIVYMYVHVSATQEGRLSGSSPKHAEIVILELTWSVPILYLELLSAWRAAGHRMLVQAWPPMGLPAVMVGGNALRSSLATVQGD